MREWRLGVLNGRTSGQCQARATCMENVKICQRPAEDKMVSTLRAYDLTSCPVTVHGNCVQTERTSGLGTPTFIARTSNCYNAADGNTVNKHMLLVHKHKMRLLSMCSGDRKTALSYIIVETTAVLFTTYDFVYCNRVSLASLRPSTCTAVHVRSSG